MTPQFDELYESALGRIVRNALLGATIATSIPSVYANDPKLELQQDQKDDLYTRAKQYISKHEGIRYKPYKDSKGNWTVGIGHKILKGETFPNELSPQEVGSLFAKDLNEHTRRARRIFPKFDQYNIMRQCAILDGVFRGDLSKSPKTIKLINAGKWEEAAKEYLNNREYQKSKAEDTGVWKRMEENAKMFAGK